MEAVRPLPIGDTQAILEALEAIGQRLSSLDLEVAKAQAKLALRLPLPPYPEVELQDGLRQQLLRGATGPATSLAAWAPGLSASGSITEALAAGDEAAARRIFDGCAASVRAACLQALAGSRAVALVFGVLQASRRCGAEVDRATAYRLASICSLVLGPAINAVRLLQLHCQFHPQHPFRPTDLSLVVRIASDLAATAVEALKWQHPVTHLAYGGLPQGGEMAAAEALRATACKPAALGSFWGQATCVLGFCANQDLGKDVAVGPALDSLISFTTAALALDDGQGPVFAALVAQGGSVAERFIHLVAWRHRVSAAALLQGLQRQAGEASQAQFEAWFTSCALLASLLGSARSNGVAAVAPADVAAVATRLVPLYLRGGVEPEFLLGCIFAQAELVTGWVKFLGCTRTGVEPGSGAGPGLPAGCWEGAAVCAAALQAVVEREGQLLRAEHAGGGGAPGAAAEAPEGLVHAFEKALRRYEGMLGQLGGCGSAPTQAGLGAIAALSPPDLAAAAGAMEAMLRLSAALALAPPPLGGVRAAGDAPRLKLYSLAEPLTVWLFGRPKHQLSGEEVAALGALLDTAVKAVILKR